MGGFLLFLSSRVSRKDRPRVLVVERDGDLRLLLVRALWRLGCAARGARDLDEGERATAPRPPAVVIVALDADVEEAAQVANDRLRRLRGDGRGSKVLVLLARPAAAASHEERPDADGVLGKPFELPEFERAVRALLPAGSWAQCTSRR
jgi:DNA-binding response OmpR family regulator